MTRSATLFLTFGMLSVAATAQAGLGEQIATAVRGADWEQQLGKLGLHQPTAAELVDALAPLRGQLPPRLWVRAASLVARRDRELGELWRTEPDKRADRAPVLAPVITDWAKRYQQAGAAERADIEHAARFATPFHHHWEQHAPLDGYLRDLEANVALQRITVAAIRAAENPFAASLRRTDGNGEEQRGILEGQEPSCTPFHLADALTDPEPQVRARAALALRRMLHLEPPPWLAEVLLRDSGVNIHYFVQRWAGGTSAVYDAEANELLAGIEADVLVPVLPRLADTHGLTEGMRARLCKSLLDAGQRAVRAAANDTIDLRPPARGAETRGMARAIECFRAAARLSALAHQHVLELAVIAADPRVRLTTMLALREPGTLLALRGATPSTAAGAAAAAPLIAALLDDANEQIGETAAALAAGVLEQHRDAALQGKVVRLALDAISRDAETLALRRAFYDCPVGGEPLGPPNGKAAWLVQAAAAGGEARLLDPLITELRRCLGPAPDADSPTTDAELHVWFVLDCLGKLAARADEKQTRQLFELLHEQAKDLSPLGSRRAMLAEDVMFGIYPTVPDELLPWYRAVFANGSRFLRLADRLDPVLDLVPEQRARRALLAADEPWLPHASLWLRAPEMLAARWADRASRDTAVYIARQAAPRHFDILVALAVAGRLPRELTAAAAPPRATSLASLAQTMPETAADAEVWARWFENAIDGATATEPADDLRALQKLGTCAVRDVAHAAARRAATLGGEGRVVARATFARLLAGSDVDQAAETLRVAVAAAVEVPDLQAVIARLRQSRDWLPRAVADAATLRFHGADARTFHPDYPAVAIEFAGIDVDVDTLRAALGSNPQQNLWRLIQTGSTRNAITAMQLAGELPWWTRTIERFVTQRTTDTDPRVRLAAYAALRSRDAGVWACAWLAHEAAFDPDPAVREFATK